MELTLDLSSVEDYQTFLAIKRLPLYSFCGRSAWFPDEYAQVVGVVGYAAGSEIEYEPSPFLFDYQRDITRLALRKRKFAIFADCGLGKSLCYLEYVRTIAPLLKRQCRGALIMSPLMVIQQTVDEANRWYGERLPIDVVSASDLPSWLKSCGGKVGITNYESLRGDCERGQLGCLIVDESSILKSHYGKYGQELIRLGKGLPFKLCGTGTPAPNDRIEYANHAVFLDQFPTVNSFLAKYFINRGQTNERWEIKPHALKPFYLSVSHWSIVLTNPASYGWKDNCESIPPIRVHIHDVDMTGEQRRAVSKATGGLFAVKAGGITKRSTLSKIAKGLDGSATVKYEFIRHLVDSWPDQSTIIWCWYNDEQDRLAAMFPDAVSIDGRTPHSRRMELIDDFKSRRTRILISKPQVLGFGLNLQVATKQVFSSLIDSYEKYYQAVKRSNRYGSTVPLDVHIPVLDVELPMVENVLRKAAMVQRDAEEQESIFRQHGVRI